MAVINPPTSPRNNLSLEGRTLNILQVSLAFNTLIATLSGLGILLFLINGIQEGAWQFYILAGLSLPPFFFSIKSALKNARGEYSDQDFGWANGFFSLLGVAIAFLVDGAGLLIAINYIIIALSLTSTLGLFRSGTASLFLGLTTASIAALAGALSPFSQVQSETFIVILIAFLAMAVMVFFLLGITQFISTTLQIRLVTAFLVVLIIPLAIATIALSETTINTNRNQIQQNMIDSAEEVALSLDRFFENNLKAIQQEAKADIFSRYFENLKAGKREELDTAEIRMIFRVLELRESSERAYLSSYALLNSGGYNVYDTIQANRGRYEGRRDYFLVPFTTGKPYVSPVTFNLDGTSYFHFSAPIFNNQNEVVGVLRATYNTLVLQRYVTNYAGFGGPNTHVIIFDENLVRLADTYQPEMIFTTVTALTPEQRAELIIQKRIPDLPMIRPVYNADLARFLQTSELNKGAILEIEGGEEGNEVQEKPEIAGISSMKTMPWKVVFFQAEFDETPYRKSQTRVATIIATLLAYGLGFAAVGVSNILASPLRDLANVARRLANGDLKARSDVHTSDEFGMLASVFNQTAEQLEKLVTELEERVAQRTAELERRNQTLTYRTNQLNTIAQVARGIVSAQELTRFLENVTELISDRFGFYHVGIFLLDANREYAVLRAANSPGGKRMLARSHMLKVGQTGIVGYVTSRGEPRIALDVGQDAVFFNNPDLPTTRSEMALPLKVGDEIIGALDVQSELPNAFSEEDLSVFTTLADQVAIAIYNNQLYNETLRALAEAQQLHRQYLQQEWAKEVRTHQHRGYRYSAKGVEPIHEDLDLKDVEYVYQNGKPYIFTEALSDNTQRAVLSVPISIRGEIIGVIRVQDQGEARVWSDNELQAVQDVAQQVGVALETARLFEKTVHRAERERRVLEITGKIRSTNDPKEMLQIAAAELQRVLGASKAQIFLLSEDEEELSAHGNGSGSNNGNQ
ncbi:MULTISPECIES: GAF domain-containing protein [Anaerolinea]|uniref:GAF domain-containing protein n=1 Tax=Anaerolinea TaxID=233189 RepID=UPI00262A36DC|nr:GAF domain-containing protein [Anaerolinea thermophila]